MTAGSFDFHGTAMTVKLATEEASGAYCVIEMRHPPYVGPALHVHPHHPETFVVLEGNYTFWIGDIKIEAEAGDAVSVPPGAPHKYKVGCDGGRALVISPPNLEHYFLTVSGRLASGALSLEEESAIAARHGQDFLELSSHWTTP